jgi:glucose-6-phosphate isomerase
MNELIARVWRRDTSVFAAPDAPPEVHAAIANRLGWLDAPVAMSARLAEVREVIAGARADGLTRLVLLGMGGSSLCAEVLRETAAFSRHAGAIDVLDTTDERAILQTRAALNPAQTLVLVASKSGGTVEVTALERYFRAEIERAVPDNAGRHFVAITDPGTPLVAHADAAKYRHTFINPADIGGRYSALSLFGLVPAAWLDLDLDAMVGGGAAMAARCQNEPSKNPGFALGAFMASNALAGRDKLTILLPLSIASLGLWIEQLVAESTGKQGHGVLPVVDETPLPVADITQYGRDRAFVAVLTGDRQSEDVESRAAALEAAGYPVFRINVAAGDLGGEFFRWEFATAIAGIALGVNPFDEPNVTDAKNRTRAVLDHYFEHGALPIDPPLTALSPRDSTISIRRIARRGPAPANAGYLALLDYLPTDRGRMGAVDRSRRRLRARTGAATTYGVGPRYLHSTGQYHKGGPNTGKFILLSGADETATPVPDAGYTFSVLKQAQALGDVAALAAAGREVLHLHLNDPAADHSTILERVLSE